MDIYGSLDSETRGFVSDTLKMSGVKSMASGFADIANSFINYNALKIDAGNMNLQAGDKFIQANAVELQAQEAANNLRRQFIGAVGNATYNAAARGVKVTSANLQDDIQRSAGELDEDIRKKKKNAAMKASNLRAEGMRLNSMAKITKRTAKAQRFSGILGGMSNIMSGVAGYAAGGSIAGENMSGQSSGWNPATSAPSAKPLGR